MLDVYLRGFIVCIVARFDCICLLAGGCCCLLKVVCYVCLLVIAMICGLVVETCCLVVGLGALICVW